MRDRVEGLGLGADDYLPKPFDFTEMVARVQALGRRPGAPKPEHLGYRDLTLDPERRLATRAGRRLALSPKEFAVLECLLAAEGRPVSAEELLERVWDQATDPFTTTVKATINRLRAKLGDPPMIETVRETRLSHRRPVMGVAHPRLARPSWLRLPRRTARLRLTALYGGLFLLSGVALLAATYALFERATEYKKPSLPKVPHTPAIQHLQLASASAGAVPAFQRRNAARRRLRRGWQTFRPS